MKTIFLSDEDNRAPGFMKKVHASATYAFGVYGTASVIIERKE